MVQPAAALADPTTPPVAAPPTPSPTATWSLPTRIAFRFGFAWFAIWLVPFPVGALPWTGWLAAPFDKGWNALTVAVGRLLLHRTVDVSPNGSGDTTASWLQLAIHLTLTIAATAIWSLVDRRTRYPRLRRWLHGYVRVGVGMIMIGYGLAKVFHSQFPFPSAAKLEQAYGDASPMGLLWTFMGVSGPYNVFTGLAETIPAVMLFFRRTATLGALLTAAVMTNVVMLNFCYDVPVKIFSTQILIASIYIAGPRLRALFDVLVLGRAVAAAPVEPLLARPRFDLAARIAGVAFCGYLLVTNGRSILESAHKRAAQNQASTGLSGAWLVERETRDGQPVDGNDPTRWQRLGIGAYKGSLRAAYHQVDGFYDRLDFHVEDDGKRLTLEPEPGAAKAVWSYAQPDNDHLTLTGALDGHTRSWTLRRDTHPRPFRLLTRGFHWVNEAPYNR